MDAKVLEEGKALLALAPHKWSELETWLWTHKDELIADAGRMNFAESIADGTAKRTLRPMITYIIQFDAPEKPTLREAIDAAIAAGDKK